MLKLNASTCCVHVSFVHVLSYVLVLCLRSEFHSALAKLAAVREQRFGYDSEMVSLQL